MTWEEWVLLKKGLRSDSIWTLPFSYRNRAVRRIPLALDTHALLKSQYWPRERLNAYRDARLAGLFRHASRIPFWKERMDTACIETGPFHAESLLQMPIVSKQDFTTRKVSSYTDGTLIRNSTFEQTSGSTGRPFGFYHDRQYELRSYAVCERMFYTAGKGERFPIITMRTRERMGFAFTNYRFFHVRGFNSLRHRLPQLVELIQPFKGKVILFGFSSWILELARLLREQHISLPLRAVMIAGEELSENRRKEIEGTLGAPVYMYYAASELGRIAFECEHRRLHINEEWSYVEVVDDSGAPLPKGKEGRIVMTLFDNHVMPFIRYDSGDLGVMSEEPCPCGRTLHTIQVRGRQLQLIRFPDKRIVSLLDISVSLDKFGSAIEKFQIVRESDYSFSIRVVQGATFEERKDDITEHVARLIHPRAQITLETVDAIESGPSGKAVYFIDRTN